MRVTLTTLAIGTPVVVNVPACPWASALVNVPAMVTGPGTYRLSGEVSSRVFSLSEVTRCEGPLPRLARDFRGNVVRTF